MVYHGYEYGHWHMGRSTMIEPIEWTADGWYKSKVKELNYQIINNSQIVSDDFNKPDLNLQWSFSGITQEENYQIKNGELTFKTLENRLHVLHCIPGTPNYEASVKLSATGNAEAGLVVYFSDAYFAGLGMKNGVVFDLSHGKKHWGPEIKNPNIKYLKLRLDHYSLYLSYSTDGKNWQPYDIALDVTGYHRNILGVYSLKIGIYGKGEGAVTVDDFVFKPIK
jgi:xylan 1,4-beta-xylosidase